MKREKIVEYMKSNNLYNVEEHKMSKSISYIVDNYDF